MAALIMRILPEIMDIGYISVKHNHLSEYFCTFDIIIIDICKIM